MKLKHIIIIIGLLSCNNVIAQQRPYYTQYIMNNYNINPGVAGIENYWDVKASHGPQWMGWQHAPITTHFTIHGPLSKSAYDRESATSFHAGGQNQGGETYWRDYTSPESHAGVRFTILNEKTGLLNRSAGRYVLLYYQP